jgi:AbrB family looped-hinge helix DNA binding protein
MDVKGKEISIFHNRCYRARNLAWFLLIFCLTETQYFCIIVIMIQETTFLTERGTLTLPSTVRKSLGLKGKQQLIVETTEQGEILLRPAALVPIEMYSEDRIKEFASDDAELGDLLDKHNIS